VDKHTFSVIGCQHAHISIFIEEMLELGYQCVGIYEKDNLQLAASIAKTFKLPLIDFEAALIDEVDIVGCAAINNEKIDIIELCEKRGKHVMVDKPAVTSRQGYERLEKVVQREKIHVGMLLTERFRSSIYTLKKKINQGELGEIVNIGMRKPHRLRPASRPQWFFSKEQCGGIIIDLFVHDFDLLSWLTGKKVISSEGFIGKNILPEHPTFYDVANLQIKLEGNLVAQLYADWHTPEASWTWGDGRIFITGTKGSVELRLSGDPFISKEGLMLQTTHEKPPFQVEIVPVPHSITQDFINRIDNGSGSLSHNEILDALKAAIEADEAVRVNTSTNIL
jgi:predicted dehydrogenase